MKEALKPWFITLMVHHGHLGSFSQHTDAWDPCRVFFFFFCYLVYKYSRGDSAVLTKLRSAEIIVAVLTEQFEVVPGSLLKITH